MTMHPQGNIEEGTSSILSIPNGRERDVGQIHAHIKAQRDVLWVQEPGIIISMNLTYFVTHMYAIQ